MQRMSSSLFYCMKFKFLEETQFAIELIASKNQIQNQNQNKNYFSITLW